MAFYYQLSNGKTVTIHTLEQLLNVDEQELLASNSGREINNPFFDRHSENEEEFEEDVLYIDLPDISEFEELDLDEDLD